MSKYFLREKIHLSDISIFLRKKKVLPVLYQGINFFHKYCKYRKLQWFIL